MALEVDIKRSIQDMLGSSLMASAGHLAWVLGLMPTNVTLPKSKKKEKKKMTFPALFQRYMLDLRGKNSDESKWHKSCGSDEVRDAEPADTEIHLHCTGR